MAIEFARAEFVKRSEGKNACCKMAYNSRTRITDEQTNVTYTFERLLDNVHHKIYLPENANSKFKKVEELANEVERSEKKSNSRLLKEYVLALPDDKELSLKDRIELAERFIEKKGFVKDSLGVQLDIHEPHDSERNWHAHILVTTRRFEEDRGLGNKARDLEGEVRGGKKAYVKGDKELNGPLWKDIQNEYFKEKGLNLRVDSISKQPSKHLGPIRMRGLSNGVRSGIEIDDKDFNRRLECELEKNESKVFIRDLEADLRVLEREVYDNRKKILKDILGEENKALSVNEDLRYGERGLELVIFEKGQFIWLDIESGKGGGLYEMVMEKKNYSFKEAYEYLKENVKDLSKTQSKKLVKRNYGRDYQEEWRLIDRYIDYGDVATLLLKNLNSKLSSTERLRFGNKGSIVVFAKNGGWKDWETGEYGNIIDLVSRELNCNKYMAKEYLMSKAGISKVYKSSYFDSSRIKNIKLERESALKEKEKERDIEDIKFKKKLVSILKQYNDCQVVGSDTIGAKYLREERSTNVLAGGDLKYGEIYTRELRGKCPALIGFARDVDGRIRATQTIFLDREGKKAKIAINKRSYGRVKGSFVDIGGLGNSNQANITIIAEGIETALSIKDGLKSVKNQNIKILASLGISNIGNYVPAMRERVIIAGDNDKVVKDNNILSRAKERIQIYGGIVSIVKPKELGDFNDLLKRKGGREEIGMLFEKVIRDISNQQNSNPVRSYFEIKNGLLSKDQIEDLRFFGSEKERRTKVGYEKGEVFGKKIERIRDFELEEKQILEKVDFKDLCRKEIKDIKKNLSNDERIVFGERGEKLLYLKGELKGIGYDFEKNKQKNIYDFLIEDKKNIYSFADFYDGILRSVGIEKIYKEKNIELVEGKEKLQGKEYKGIDIGLSKNEMNKILVEKLNQIIEKGGQGDILQSIFGGEMGQDRVRKVVDNISKFKDNIDQNIREYQNDLKKELIKVETGEEILKRIEKIKAVFTSQCLEELISHRNEKKRHKLMIEIFKSKNLICLHDDLGCAIYTTKNIRREEERLVRFADSLKRLKGDKVTDLMKEKCNDLINSDVLTGHQGDVLSQILNRMEESRLVLLQGRAGTGKSHVISKYVRILEDSGKKVLCLAPTHGAVMALKQKGVKDVRTLDSCLLFNKDVRKVEKGGVIIVDEAGMLDSTRLTELFSLARDTESRILLVGDERQLKAIGRGVGFEYLLERYKNKEGKNQSILLEEVLRQKNEWGRKVSELMSRGKVKEAVEILEEKEKLKFKEDKIMSLKELMEDWILDCRAGKKFEYEDKKILAVRNEDVTILNELVRDVLKGEKIIKGKEIDVFEQTQYGIRANKFASGDRINISETNKELGLKNGDKGKIKEITKDLVTLEFEGEEGKEIKKERIFKVSEIGMRHDYVSTIYGMQGLSGKKIYVYHNGISNLSISYVALSRQLKDLKIYVNQKATANINVLTEQFKRADTNIISLNYKSVAEAKREEMKKENKMVNKFSSWIGELRTSIGQSIGDMVYQNKEFYNQFSNKSNQIRKVIGEREIEVKENPKTELIDFAVRRLEIEEMKNEVKNMQKNVELMESQKKVGLNEIEKMQVTEMILKEGGYKKVILNNKILEKEDKKIEIKQKYEYLQENWRDNIGNKDFGVEHGGKMYGNPWEYRMAIYRDENAREMMDKNSEIYKDLQEDLRRENQKQNTKEIER